MTLSFRRLPVLGTRALITALTLTACGSAKLPNLSGFVRNDAGAIVPNAVVSSVDGAHKAITDSKGHYAFDVPANAVNDGAVSVSASNYSTLYKLVAPQSPNQDFVIRSYDTVASVMLPASRSDAPATTTVTRGDGQIKLSIPYGALSFASGAVASGQATVKLTYWHPLDDLGRLPAPLRAEVANQESGQPPYSLALRTFGMVDIEVFAGSEPLQVTAGQALLLEHKLPPAFAEAMAQKPNDMAGPGLFYFDGKKSSWIPDGNIVYDSASTSLKGELPHLTMWNFDNFQNWNPPSYCSMSDIRDGQNGCNKPQNSSVGGCVTGAAKNTDGSALTNGQVRLWMFDNEQITVWDLPTDSAGRYCAVLGARLCVPAANNTAKCDYTINDVSYLVSGVESPDDSDMPNPIPNDPECQNISGTWPTMHRMNACGLIYDEETQIRGAYTPTFEPARVRISAGSYCDNPASCGQIPDVKIGQGLKKMPPTGNNTPQTPVCKHFLPEGSACTPTLDATKLECCDPSQHLVCSDYVCVKPLQ